MKIAIISRDEFSDGIGDSFKKIFDKLNVELIRIDNENHIDNILKTCNGLLVPGNCNDIPPHYYKEEPIKEYSIDQFKLDRIIIQKFYKNNKPILAICGGAQSVNVTFGGSLNQFIDNHAINGLHGVKLNTDTFLYEIYNQESINVNSLHHQSIKDVADGFKISAISYDGIIEGIEKDNIIAVQWHPEKMNDIIFFETWIKKYVRS